MRNRHLVEATLAQLEPGGSHRENARRVCALMRKHLDRPVRVHFGAMEDRRLTGVCALLEDGSYLIVCANSPRWYHRLQILLHEYAHLLLEHHHTTATRNSEHEREAEELADELLDALTDRRPPGESVAKPSDAVFIAFGALGFVTLARARLRVWSLLAGVFLFTNGALLSRPVVIIPSVPNLSRLVAYCAGLAFMACSLALLLAWREKRVRWVLIGYALIAVAEVVLFVLAPVPREHGTGFTSYYQDQPLVIAMSLVYSTACALGELALIMLCLRVARDQDRAWLRHGLRIYAVLAIVPLGYYASRVLTRVTGVLDGWIPSTLLTTMILVAPAVLAVGLPVWVRWAPVLLRWTARWRVFWRLRPEHRRLRHVNPDVVFVSRGKRFDPHHRVRRTVLELGEWEWAQRKDARDQAVYDGPDFVSEYTWWVLVASRNVRGLW